MSELGSVSARAPDSLGLSSLSPIVRLETHGGAGRTAVYEVSDLGFLIGSAPGCDLRLAGTNLPPVICLITRQANGARFRKLVATYPITLNGQPISNSVLSDGDRVTVSSTELLIRVTPSGDALAARAAAAQT